MLEEVDGAALIDARVGNRQVQFLPRDIAGYASLDTYAGTSRPLRRSDAGGLILTTSGSAVSIVVPPASVTPFQYPVRISVAQMGAGQVTFVAGAGVQIDTPETLKIAKQFASATLVGYAADFWVLAGYLEAA